LNNKINFTFIILSLLAVLVAYNYFFNTKNNAPVEKNISYTDFVNKVNEKNISQVKINGLLIKAISKDNVVYTTAMPMQDNDLLKNLKDNKVEVSGTIPNTNSGIGMWILFLGVGFFVFMLIRSLFKKPDDQGSGNPGGGIGGGNNPFSFGRSRARLITPKEEDKVSFADVAGVDEAKEDLQEVVDFLKNPKKFQKLGAKIPKGCLLVGSPGTGKTLLARAVAGEAGVPFFFISGSDFVEMFVGVGASRVRDLFAQAKKQSPCIIFIDEIDAVGRQRGVGVGGGNDEREQTLNQLLVEMDGFTVNQGIIILAATNRADVLDQALLRPGRFDRQVTVPLPDLIGRERILQIYVSKIPLDKDFNINTVARGTTGFSGADLANLVNEATILAARQNKELVGMPHFEEARDKILMGAERKSSRMSEQERTLTAYHEAGHALVAFKVKDYYPVHKVTIIPRGRSLGVTSFMPEKDEYSRSLKQLKAQLAVLFGGRLAEELIFGKENITTGASMDIQMATNIARKMVMEWGFSDVVGRIKYSEDDNRAAYFGSTKHSSEETSREIEAEIRKLIVEAEIKAKEVLTTYAKAHKDLSEALLEYETLSGEEALKVCDGMSVKEIRENTGSSLGTKKDQHEPSVPVIDFSEDTKA
jgi:cell division protease FtsH